MKRCPHCRRDYFDDSLLYCLDDGTVLLEGPSSDEPRTAILTDTGTITPVTTDEKTRVFGSGPEANGHGSTALPITAPSRTRHRMLPMIAVGLGTLLLAGIGLGVYKYTRSQKQYLVLSLDYRRNLGISFYLLYQPRFFTKCQHGDHWN